MASRRPARIVGFGVILVVVGVNGYFLWRPEPAAPIVGVVRTTEVRVAPEVGGQLAAIKVQKGARVRAGDVVAELSADELTASVAQARAALAAATADRDNVYSGVRAEQRAGLAAEIAKAKSRLEYAEQQFARTSYLARSDTATQQSLDQATNDVASARADVAEAQANSDAAHAGPARAGPGGARHRRCGGQRSVGRARRARAAAGKDHFARAGRRRRQRDRRRGRRERPRRPAGAGDRGNRQAVALVQRAGGSAARPHG